MVAGERTEAFLNPGIQLEGCSLKEHSWRKGTFIVYVWVR